MCILDHIGEYGPNPFHDGPASAAYGRFTSEQKERRKRVRVTPCSPSCFCQVRMRILLFTHAAPTKCTDAHCCYMHRGVSLFFVRCHCIVLATCYHICVPVSYSMSSWHLLVVLLYM